MVMRVPEIQEQFRYKSADVPAARLKGMDVQTSADMFGAQSGKQLEKAGHLLQRGGAQLSHLVDDYNTTKARDAARQMQQGFLEWQSEAQKKQGEAGRATATDYDSWAKEKQGELTKGLSDVQRGRFESMAGTQMAAQRHWAEGYGNQQDQVFKKATWQAEISTAADTLATNIQEPGLAQQAMEQIKDAAFTMGQNMGIGEKATMELMRTSMKNALVPAIHARIQSGETGLASTLMKQYAPQLGGAAMAHLEAEVKRVQRAQAREARAEAREARITARIDIGQRTQDATASYMAGAKYENAPSRDEFIAAYGDRQGDLMHRELEAKRALGEDVQDLRGMTPDEQQAALVSRRPQEGEGFADRQGNYVKLEAAVKSDAKARKDDPVTYVTSHDPIVRNAHKSMMSSMTPESVNAYTTALQASMEARGMESSVGGNTPILMESDAHKMAENISTSSEPEKVLHGLRQSFGRHWPALEKQLTAGEKLPPDMSIVASGMQGRPARVLVAAAKDKEFVSGAKAALGPDYKVMQARVDASLQGMMKTLRASGATALETQLRGSTEKLAAAYMWQDGMSAKEAAEKAAKDVVTERYAFKDTYRVPKNVDADSVDIGAQQEIQNIADSASSLAPPKMPGLNQSAIAARVGSSLRRNATWITNEDESGLVLFLGGVPVRNVDGSMVRRSWDALRLAAEEAAPVETDFEGDMQ